jgi:4-carboxymuconolactone decarboxylase
MRLPEPGALSPPQQEISDRIRQAQGDVAGPVQVLLHSPELSERVQALGTYCLSGSSLRPRLRELLLLIAARRWGAEYCWNAHVVTGVHAGLEYAALKVLARGQRPRFCEADEEIIYRFATELLDRHFVTDDTFAAALDLFGLRGVVDAIGAIGSFSMEAMLVNAFQIAPQPGRFAAWRADTSPGDDNVPRHTFQCPPRPTGRSSLGPNPFQ